MSEWSSADHQPGLSVTLTVVIPPGALMSPDEVTHGHSSLSSLSSYTVIIVNCWSAGHIAITCQQFASVSGKVGSTAPWPLHCTDVHSHSTQPASNQSQHNLIINGHHNRQLDKTINSFSESKYAVQFFSNQTRNFHKRTHMLISVCGFV